MAGLLRTPPAIVTAICLLWCSLGSCAAHIWIQQDPDVQYGHLDANVTLLCGKSQSKTVAWQLEGSPALPRHRVTPDGSLVLLRAALSAQGRYSCRDRRGFLLGSVKLRLGLPPGLLSTWCQVPNHSHVRCSWDQSVETFLPVEYNASLRGVGRNWQTCVVNASHNYCDVVHPPFWDMIHTLRITATNALGSTITDARFKLEALLKPDPPQSVTVEQVEGYPERLMVSWDFPSSWPVDDSFPLTFRIRYRPSQSQYWSEVDWEESPAVILDALAGHLHQVQVGARDGLNSETQWSDWSPLLYGRPWQVAATSESPQDDLPDYFFPFQSKPETHKPVARDDSHWALAVLLALLAVAAAAAALLTVALWARRQRERRRWRRPQQTKQELASVVKMKSVPV
ncbi:interleukin-11 receptor subunit alpha [Stigmatopora nigra]